MHQASPVRGCSGVQDAVEDRIAKIDVAGRHVDLGAQHAGPVRKLAGAHPAQQIEVFLDRALAIGTVAAGLGQRAAPGAHLLRREVVDVGIALADQLLGPFVQLLEVIRSEVQVLAPVEAEPAHVILDGLDVLELLLHAGWCRRSAGGSGRRSPRPPRS